MQSAWAWESIGRRLFPFDSEKPVPWAGCGRHRQKLWGGTEKADGAFGCMGDWAPAAA